MKKSLIASSLFSSLFAIVLMKFASAYYDSSDTFNLSDLINQIDPSIIILSVIFIVSFALMFFSLKNIFRGDKAIPAIVSLAMSILIVYGISKSGFDFENLFYDMGITLEVLHIIFPIFIIALVLIFVFFIIFRTGRKARKQLHDKGPGWQG